MIKLNNILIPTDFSENSIPAYDLAQYLAKQNHAALHLMHVIDPKLILRKAESTAGDSSVIMLAEEELRRFLAKTPPAEISIKEILISGTPSDEIIKYAVKNRMDLIVLSTHGWTGLTHLPMGSTTKKVLSSSEIPVICVNPKTSFLREVRSSFKSTWAENWVG